jgi:diaminopimelate decarboxylase
MHTGSDILDIEVFYTPLKFYLMQRKNFKDLEFLDFGSGFKVPYKKDDIETDIEELGKKLTKRFKAFVLSMEKI